MKLKKEPIIQTCEIITLFFIFISIVWTFSMIGYFNANGETLSDSVRLVWGIIQNLGG